MKNILDRLLDAASQAGQQVRTIAANNAANTKQNTQTKTATTAKPATTAKAGKTQTAKTTATGRGTGTTGRGTSTSGLLDYASSFLKQTTENLGRNMTAGTKKTTGTAATNANVKMPSTPAAKMYDNAFQRLLKTAQDARKNFTTGTTGSSAGTAGGTRKSGTVNLDEIRQQMTNGTAGNRGNQRTGKGNIDLFNRPTYRQPDGSVSTVNSISFWDDDEQKEILVPTIVNGKQVSDDEAIDHYYRTGEYLGKFNTGGEADRYAQSLHNQQEQIYGQGGINDTLPRVLAPEAAAQERFNRYMRQLKGMDQEEEAGQKASQTAGKTAGTTQPAAPDNTVWGYDPEKSMPGMTAGQWMANGNRIGMWDFGKLNSDEAKKMLDPATYNRNMQYMGHYRNTGLYDDYRTDPMWWSDKKQDAEIARLQTEIGGIDEQLGRMGAGSLTVPEGADGYDLEGRANEYANAWMRNGFITTRDRNGNYLTYTADDLRDPGKQEEAAGGMFRHFFGEDAYDRELAANGGRISDRSRTEMMGLLNGGNAADEEKEKELKARKGDLQARVDEIRAAKDSYGRYNAMLEQARQATADNGAEAGYIKENDRMNFWTALTGDKVAGIYSMFGGDGSTYYDSMMDEIGGTRDEQEQALSRYDHAYFYSGEERKIFQDYVNANDLEGALAFHQGLVDSGILNYRYSQWEKDRLEAEASAAPISTGFATVVQQKLQPFFAIGTQAARLLGDTSAEDPNSDWNYLSRAVDTVRSRIAQNFGQDVEGWTGNTTLGKFGEMFVQGIFSGADSGADYLVGKGLANGLIRMGLINPSKWQTAAQAGSLGTMFLEVFQGSYTRALQDSDGDGDYATLTALLDAGSEIFFETVGGADFAFREGESAAKYALLTYLGELIEEEGGNITSPVINTLKDNLYNIATTGETNWETWWDEQARAKRLADPEKYKGADGVSRSYQDTTEDFLRELFVETPFTTAVSTGPKAVQTGYQINWGQNQVGANVKANDGIQAVIEYAQNSGDQKLQSWAQRIAGRVAKGQKISDTQVGRLFSAVMADSNSQVAEATGRVLKGTVVETLQETYGESMDADTRERVAEIISKAVAQGEDNLSREERSIVSKYPRAASLMSDLTADQRGEAANPKEWNAAAVTKISNVTETAAKNLTEQNRQLAELGKSQKQKTLESLAEMMQDGGDAKSRAAVSVKGAGARMATQDEIDRILKQDMSGALAKATDAQGAGAGTEAAGGAANVAGDQGGKPMTAEEIARKAVVFDTDSGESQGGTIIGVERVSVRTDAETGEDAGTAKGKPAGTEAQAESTEGQTETEPGTTDGTETGTEAQRTAKKLVSIRTQYLVRTADGRTVHVNAEDVRAADQRTAAAMAFIESSDMDRQTASDLMDVVTGEDVTAENVEAVLADARNMIIRGHLGMAFPDSIDYAPEAARALYQKGQAAAITAEEARKGRTARNGGSILNPGNGTVTYRGVDAKSLDGDTRKQVDAAVELAKRIGYNLIIENDTENRNRFGEYDAVSGSVIINLAGQKKNGEHQHLLVAMSHEVTHLLENNSPEAYAKLREFVMKEMRKNGVDLVTRIGQKMDNYNYQIGQMRKRGAEIGDISIDGAIAEVVADACDQVLGNDKLIQKLANESPALFQKIKGYVSDFMARVKAAVMGMRESGSIDSLYIRDMDTLAEKWGIALDEVQGKANQIQEEAEMNVQKAEPTTGQQKTQLALRDSYGNLIEMTQQELDKNKRKVAKSIPEYVIKKSEYQSLLEGDFIEKGLKYFNLIGNKATNKILGEVILDKYGLKHIAGRKNLAEIKAITLPAVKHIIEKGEIVHVNNGHRGNDMAIIAGKVSAEIGGKTEDYYVGVLVAQNNGGTRGQQNKYSFHAALIIEENATHWSPTNGRIAGQAAPVTAQGSVPVYKILQEIATFNSQSGQNENIQLDLAERIESQTEGLASEETEKQEPGDGAAFSFDEGETTAADWLMAMDPKDIEASTKAERELVRTYQKTRNEITEIEGRIRTMREALKTAKGDEARKYRINIQTEENRLKRAQEKLNGITSGRDFEYMLRRAQESIDYLLGVKSREELNKAAGRMRQRAEEMRQKANEAAAGLEGIAAAEEKAVARRFFNQADLNGAVKDLANYFWGEKDAAKMDTQWIEDGLTEIGLKIAAKDGSVAESIDRMSSRILEEIYGAGALMESSQDKSAYGGQLSEITVRILKATQKFVPGTARAGQITTGNRTEIQGLMNYVRQVSSMTSQAARGMRQVAEMAEGLKKQTEETEAAAAAIRRRLNTAIRYFDQLNRQQNATASAEKMEATIRQIESKAAQRILEEQAKWSRTIENDKNVRKLAADNLRTRKKINTAYTRMAKLILDESDLKNVPASMQGVARAAIRMILQNDANGGKKITGVDFQTLQRSYHTLDLIDKRDGTELNLDALAEATGDDDVAAAVEDALADIREGIAFYRSGTRGRTAVNLQGDKTALERIQKGMSQIYDMVTKSRQIFQDGKQIELADAAYEVETEAKKKEPYREFVGGLGKLIRGMDRNIHLGNMTPVYFFKNLKNNGLARQYAEFEAAEDRYGKIMMDAKARVTAAAEKAGYGEWDMEKKHEIRLENGKSLRMTLGQMLSLEATWKREHTLGPEMSNHLAGGGIVLEEKSEKKLIGREAREQKPTRISEGDMKTIEDLLTDTQKAYVDDMVEILSKVMGAYGNEASMRMYGIEKYKETYYFPFSVWDGVKNKASNTGGAVNPTNNNRAAHQSFTNRRKAGASNAVLIRDFNTVCAEHINQMATYATFGSAIEGMNRILNFRVMEDTENGTASATQRNVESILRERYGENAVSYLRQFMTDLNGGAVQQGGGLGQSLMSMFKKNAVGGSLSVSLQQPLSYIRAATMIETKYLAAASARCAAKVGNRSFWENEYGEMTSHSGVAAIKDMGKFDMNFARGAAEWLSPDTLETSRARRAYNKIEDVTNKLPEKMDQITWIKMWNAIKIEQAEAHPGMDQGSEEFLSIVGKRFNDVMRKTQVYDSVLVKSQLMRSQGWFEKSITAFRAEPTVALNLFMDAWANRKTEGGKKNAAAAAATFLLSAIAQAAIKGIMSAGRKPDEKKTLAENFVYRFDTSLLSEVNPLSLIPGFDNVMDLLAGNDINDNAWGMIKTMATSLQKIWNIPTGKDLTLDSGYRYIEDTVGQITQMFTGIPAKNLMRDSRAVYNWFLGNYANRETSEAVMKYQTREAIGADSLAEAIENLTGIKIWDDTATSYARRIYEAELAGDTETAEEIREYLQQGKGKKEEDVNSSVASQARKDAKEGKRTAKETAEFLLGGGYTDETDYITEQYKKGKLTQDEVRELYEKYFPKKDANTVFWNTERDKYKEGKISESEAKTAYLKYNPKKKDQDWNEYLWGQAEKKWEDGGMTDGEAKSQYMKLHPKAKDQDWNDYLWRKEKKRYEDGDITESQAKSQYMKLHPKAKDQDWNDYLWNQAKGRYEAGETSESQTKSQYMKLHPKKTEQDWNEYLWSLEWAKYKNGEIAESQAQSLYKKYHPYTSEKEIGSKFWSLIKEEYKNGEISRSEAEKKYDQYFPKNTADDKWEAFDALDYSIESGTSASSAYYRMNGAIQDNDSKEITKVVDNLLKHGKKKNGIKKSIESKWEDTYRAMRNGSSEKVRLRDGITKAMKAAGYSEREIEKMFNKWAKTK